MPQPTPSDVHVDAPLTNISVAFRQMAENYVATRVFPTVPVRKQSDKYFIFDRDAWLRDDAQERGPAQESAGSGYTLSTATYNAVVYAFHKDVDDQTRENADSPLDVDRNATQYVTQVLMNRLEIQWVTDFFASSIWTTDITPGTLWSAASSTPIEDVDTGKETILKATGFLPNTLVLGYEVFNTLRQHADVVDRIKHTSQAAATETLLANLFDVDRVLVAKAVKNTAAENATFTGAFTHGKHALLCYAAPSAGLEVPSAGYTMEWTGVSEGLGATTGIRRIPMPWLGRNHMRIEGQMAWDNKVVSADLGYFFDTVIA